MNFDEIKNQKIKEAQEVYKQLGLKLNDDDNYYEFYNPYDQLDQGLNDKSNDLDFNWTRLSNNTNLGHITK